MTFALRAALALLVAGMLASPIAAASPTYTFRDVAFVTIIGRGTVQSTPHGIDCPRSCRAIFVRGTHVSFTAAAAPGWRFVYFSSLWCPGKLTTCAFDLVSSHDCIGGACPIGAYGVRAVFVREKPPT